MFAEMPLDNRTVGKIHAPGRSNWLCWTFNRLERHPRAKRSNISQRMAVL
jgi:hypothetical protein